MSSPMKSPSQSSTPPLSPAPVVGDWYRRPDGTQLEVVAIDVEEDTIEIQHFDGTVEEFDMESWGELELQRTEPPEDWTGSVDVEPEDYESERDFAAGSAATGGAWTEALVSLDRSEASGYSEWPTPRL